MGTGNIFKRGSYDKIDIVEQGLRYALLYPYSFFKMGVLDRDKVIDSVAIRAVHPWDVVVDFEAEDFAASRFIGHRYFLPYNENLSSYRFEDEALLTNFRLEGSLNVHAEYGYLVHENTARTISEWWRGHDLSRRA